ncbi:MAG: flagellar motor switch protein FliM [Porticoccaceae bacterium]
MSQNDLLLQDEIDALLNSVSGETEPGADSASRSEQRIRAYDPATQHRVIRQRLHALDIINERFARLFRISLFNLIRRNADITVESVRYQSYSNFSRNLPVPTNINLINMKPLRGTALVVFPPAMVFMVVDNLFGGDGRFLTKSEGREFTNTEQRIIRRLLALATDTYQDSWKSIYPLQISYLRSEMQAKFANITNSPNEIVVNTTFHMEVGNTASDFHICIPYSMIEPLRDLLSSPVTDNHNKGDRTWTRRMASEIKQTEVELVADFVTMPSRIGQVLSLKVGDVLPIALPETVTARVDGVPVMSCSYGSQDEHLALRILHIIEHVQTPAMAAEQLIKAAMAPAKESDDDRS